MRIQERFGANLRRARKRTGLSQEAVALRAAVHRTEVGLLERGERTPGIATALKVAGAVGVPLADLLAGIDWTPAETQPGQFKPPAEVPCNHA
jgi:transcriptional regulator with XRE-family HTH domain